MLGKVKKVLCHLLDQGQAIWSHGSVRKVCVSLSFWDEGGVKHDCGRVGWTLPLLNWMPMALLTVWLYSNWDKTTSMQHKARSANKGPQTGNKKRRNRWRKMWQKMWQRKDKHECEIKFITFTDEITSAAEYVDTRKCVFVHKWVVQSLPFVETCNHNQGSSIEIGNDAPGRSKRDSQGVTACFIIYPSTGKESVSQIIRSFKGAGSEQYRPNQFH